MANLSVDNLLTQEESSLLSQHSSNCDSCTRREEASAAISSSLELVNPPDTLTPGIIYKISLEPVLKSRWRNLLPRNFTIAAACLIAALLYVSYTASKETPNAQPQIDTALGEIITEESSEPADNGRLFIGGFSASDTAGNNEAGTAPAEAPEFFAAPEEAPEPKATARDAISVTGTEPYCGVLIQYGSVPEGMESIDVSESEARVVMTKTEFEEYGRSHPEALVASYENVLPEALNGMIVFYINQ